MKQKKAQNSTAVETIVMTPELMKLPLPNNF
jgi:hypothetical protein